MAVSYDPINNTYTHVGVPFNYTRGNPIPLDNTSIYSSFEAAQTYASTNPVAYVGQIITVVEGEQEYSEWSFGELTGYAITTSDGKLFINSVEAKLDSTQLTLTAKVDNVTVVATRTVTKPFDVTQYQIVDASGTLKELGSGSTLIFASKAAADAYVLTDDAQFGQLLTVVDEGTKQVSVYKITYKTLDDGSVVKSLDQIDTKIEINVDDLPISAGTGVEITTAGMLNALVGSGLSTDTNNYITVKTGNGLSADIDTGVSIKTGTGLSVDANGVGVKLGNGLTADDDGNIILNILTINGGSASDE